MVSICTYIYTVSCNNACVHAVIKSNFIGVRLFHCLCLKCQLGTEIDRYRDIYRLVIILLILKNFVGCADCGLENGSI